jgi:multidrug efflux pump
MDITRAAIEKNRITVVALFVIAVAGVMAYISLPRAEDPGFIIRTATVVTSFPGASPERVELLVTDKIEKEIQKIPEVDYIESESSTGTSIIWVNILNKYFDVQPIWDNLRRKVEDAEPFLPDGTGRPVVNDEFGDVFGIIVTITGEDFLYRELKEIADDVRDEMLLLPDVAKVDIYGAQHERIFVEYNNARLAELGLSTARLQQILESRNIIMSGGDVTTEFEKVIVEPSGNFQSVEELRRSLISLPGSKDVIALEDLVEIKRGYIDPPTQKMRCEGKPCLGLAIAMQEGGNIIELGKRVEAFIAQVQAEYPVGIEFDFVQSQPNAVQKKISDFMGNLYQAVAIVAIVMFIFLGLRTGLVVASLVPSAMIMSFMVMGFLNVGLDQMSLAALIIALGMLVDNAIVMSESIMVQMGAGKPAVQAAVDSGKELRIPLLTSSLTTIAAFAPIYLAESNAGEYTAPIFIVVAITLLSSWMLSLTMVPMLCARFLKVKANPGEAQSFDSRFYRFYRGFLLVILRLRWLTVAVVIGVFVLSLKLFTYLPIKFFPPNDRPTFTAEVELPTGTPIERSEAVVVELANFMKKNLKTGPERKVGLTNWASFIGNGGPRYILPYSPELARPEYSYLIINGTSRDVLEELIAPMEAFANERFPDLKATIRPLDMGPPAWPPVEVRIRGRDRGTLFKIVAQVKEKLRSIPGTKLIDDNWGARTKKILVRVNESRARRGGVTNEDIAVSLQTFLVGFDTTEYREEDRLIPITLRSVSAQRKDIDQLETLNVYAQATGKSVPLNQVADIEVVWEPARIRRWDRLKTVTVEAGTDPGITATDVNRLLEPWLNEQQKSWPLGYTWAFGGENEESGKAQASIFAKLPVAGLIILLLLVGQFNSIRRPLIILLTIPLGLIGVVIGLLATNLYFGFMTLLGIISLAGIVINNAIVLLDRIRIEIEEEGLEPSRAVIEAAQKRFRPILLTTATTVCGLIPLYMGGGPMFEPMAVTILAGLLFATVLTLGVVPVLYSIFFRVSYRGFRY